MEEWLKELVLDIVHLLKIKLLDLNFLYRDLYANEYDALNPLEFDSSLTAKKCKGLLISGWIYSINGYEKSIALDLMAGINASSYIDKKESFILKRDGV